VLEEYRGLHENLRFYGGILAWLGHTRASIPAPHGRRYAGTSVYSLGNRIRLAAAIIVAPSDRPLRFSVGLGLTMAAASFLYGLYVVFRALVYDYPVAGWATLIVSIYLVGGVLMIILGIIGIYIGKMYNETKRRPLYVVIDRIGFASGRSVEP
jgi:dolichol-phosphate mannosyltransferase